MNTILTINSGKFKNKTMVTFFDGDVNRNLIFNHYSEADYFFESWRFEEIKKWNKDSVVMFDESILNFKEIYGKISE